MIAAPDIAAILEWLIDGARDAATPDAVLAELCDRLVDRGIPLWRVAVFVRTLHPQVMGRSLRWRSGAGVTISEAPFEVFDSDSFRGSPVARVYEEARPIRLRLDGVEAGAFPQLAELRAEGGTDYLAFPLLFSNGEIHVVTCATRRAGGFTDPQRAALEAVNAPLARVTEIRALRRTAVNLLDTYVGKEAGARILAGQIRRGFTETIRAAIWLSDMRGFTALADRISPPALIELLNRYFDCQIPAILSHGGEVLKFIGDGLLAIFPLAAEAEPQSVCAAALAAAAEVRSAIAALHDSRLQDLAASLGRTTLLSAEFARYCGAGAVPLGDFALAGFREPQPAYGLADETG